MITPEQSARIQIDAQLGAAGWIVQDIATLNLSAGEGIVVREMQSLGGPADYILFADGKALGVVEAKKVGTTLSAVAGQSARFTAAQRHWLEVIKNYVALNGAFATDDPTAYLDAWQSVDSDEGVPLAVANRVFGGDPKAIIEELNTILVA